MFTILQLSGNSHFLLKVKAYWFPLVLKSKPSTMMVLGKGSISSYYLNLGLERVGLHVSILRISISTFFIFSDVFAALKFGILVPPAEDIENMIQLFSIMSES